MKRAISRIFIATCIVALLLSLIAWRLSHTRREEWSYVEYRDDTKFESTHVWFEYYRGEACVGVATARQISPPPDRVPTRTHVEWEHIQSRFPYSLSIARSFRPYQALSRLGFVCESRTVRTRNSFGVGGDLAGLVTVVTPTTARVDEQHPVIAQNRSTRLVAPIWALVLIFSILPIREAWQKYHSRHRRLTGLCVQCGYDLRGGQRRCPECGKMTRSLELTRKMIRDHHSSSIGGHPLSPSKDNALRAIR